MKIYRYLGILAAVTLLSCRGTEEETVQNIDQTLHMYLKNAAGQDLLNPKLDGSYKTVALTDLGGKKDRIAISSFSLKKDSDTVTYLDYTFGATRYLVDSISPVQKTYESKIELALNKTTATSTLEQDTLVLSYSWTPTNFQLSAVKYNGATVFTKSQGAANTFTVVK